ncbi:MAG: hypothetical protein ASARMPRED_008826 [Alectoria sarmentosa]|nr:MAG: hypothetical protein ASARMPRED_008826 [Alectoria sarmentosa]
MSASHQNIISQNSMIILSEQQRYATLNKTSRAMAQEVLIERSMAALAISNDTELKGFPFMELAVEIRLEIYGYLLVAYPSRLRPHKYVTLDIYFTNHTADADRGMVTTSRPTGGRSGHCTGTGLTPQILRTCKAINREATPMLYGENVFLFQLEESLEGFMHCHNIPRAVKDSILATFLRQVGQQNAATLKKLALITDKADMHVYAQRAQIMICRGLDGWIEIDTGPSELFDDGYSSLDRPDPAVCQEEQEAMQEAVADMVREITWLEHLSFAGFDGHAKRRLNTMAASESKSLAKPIDSMTFPNDTIPLGGHGLEETALGFLDLPTEIRLEIYGYLLLASATFVSEASKTTSSDRDLALSIEVVIDLYSSKPGAVRLAHNLSEALPWRCYPAIISTCGAIYEEATEVLYGKNVFQFRLPENGSWDCSILEQCENIFKYNGKEWWDFGPCLLTEFPLANFLNRIGPRNAASLKAIELVTSYCDFGNYRFRLAARLLAYGVPGLKFIRVFIDDMGICKLEPLNLTGGNVFCNGINMTRAKQNNSSKASAAD